MTITVSGPDNSSFDFPDGTPAETITSAMAKHYGAPPVAPAAPPVYDRADPRFADQSVKSTLRGIPFLGAGIEKASAGVSALAQPLTGVGDNSSTIADRYVKNLEQEEAAKKDYETEHPIKSAVEGMVGGTLALGGAGGAVPAVAKALGMTGKLIPATLRATASGAGIGAGDAALRGEDPTTGGTVGALTGAGGVVLGKGAGKVWDAARGAFREAPAPVPSRTMQVNGVDVPVRESVLTRDPAASQQEQGIIHGTEGDAAQAAARAHGELTDAGMGRAHSNLAASMDPTGTRPESSPMAAGEAISAEVSAQEAARAAAEAQRLQAIGREQQSIRADVNTSPTPGVLADSPRTASQSVSDALIGSRDRAAAARDRAYEALRTTEGDFSAPALTREAPLIRSRLDEGTDPVRVNDVTTPYTAMALRDIEANLGKPRRTPEPSSDGSPSSPAAAIDRDVADIRAKFGDDVASAYQRQNAAAVAPLPEAPKAQSLLEFIASKGGLGPDGELNAIGGHGHTVNVEGMGRRKLVRQGGWPLDYAREAAEEAGYLRGSHKGTSTVNDLLDAINAEIRGQKRYPEGFEGHVGKKESRALSEREQHELDAHTRGLEEDLAAAGHGGMGADVKKRAVKLMADERLGPDEAVDRALRQLEQEDAAGLGRAGSDFPGDRPASPLTPETPGRPITADTIDEWRKRLISMQRDANATARRTGDFSDVRGMRRVIAEFDRTVERVARSPDGFTGDASELLGRLSHARGLHSELKRTFGPQNPKDDVGKAIEKIVGNRNMTPAEIETVAPMLFGPSAEPGGALQARIARRLIDVYGRDSREVAALKQGLISHLADAPAGLEPLSAEKVADRVHKFFSGTKGVGLAQELFSPSERARMLAHANRMRQGTDPAPAGFVEKTVAKWAGRDGQLKASPKTIVDDLMGSTGTKGTAPELVQHLKRHLSPEAVGTLKQGVWSRITESQGAIPWKDQKVGERIIKFLDGDGNGMADALFTPKELKAMREIGEAHIKMLPIEGTTNPSKSGYVMERAFKSMAHNLLPFLGLHAGGLPGVAAAFGAKSMANKISSKRAAVKAQELFYGPQARRSRSRLPQQFGALGGALAANQSR
jgi:hypothetical protein